MQIITDIMGKRPRLDFTESFHFKNSYLQEVQCLEAHKELIKEVLSYQMKEEKEINLHLKKYL